MDENEAQFLPWLAIRENFDVLNAAFTDKYPDFLADNNDVSLMIVWLSGRLPYSSVEEDATPE